MTGKCLSRVWTVWCTGPSGLRAVLQWLLLQLVLVHAATAWLDADGKPLQHFVIKRKLHSLTVYIQRPACLGVIGEYSESSRV